MCGGSDYLCNYSCELPQVLSLQIESGNLVQSTRDGITVHQDIYASKVHRLLQPASRAAVCSAIRQCHHAVRVPGGPQNINLEDIAWTKSSSS